MNINYIVRLLEMITKEIFYTHRLKLDFTKVWSLTVDGHLQEIVKRAFD